MYQSTNAVVSFRIFSVKWLDGFSIEEAVIVGVAKIKNAMTMVQMIETVLNISVFTQSPLNMHPLNLLLIMP